MQFARATCNSSANFQPLVPEASLSWFILENRGTFNLQGTHQSTRVKWLQWSVNQRLYDDTSTTKSLISSRNNTMSHHYTILAFTLLYLLSIITASGKCTLPFVKYSKYIPTEIFERGPSKVQTWRAAKRPKHVGRFASRDWLCNGNPLDIMTLGACKSSIAARKSRILAAICLALRFHCCEIFNLKQGINGRIETRIRCS